jgi:hypothetical protein
MNISWKSKVSHISQIGGIETSVLDNGPGKGNRIAWITTGSGLRYKLIIDRSMDIADAFMNNTGLSWISHFGSTAPDISSKENLEWLRTFTGGLLTTCGLSHVGGPEKDESGSRGLHGRISNIPAEIISVGQPTPYNDLTEISITGIMRESSVFGPSLEMKRTISSPLFGAKIKIRDEVLNAGNNLTPLMMIYHCNFGYPLLDEGSEILWEGKWQSRGNRGDNAIFNNDHNFRICPPILDSHAGFGEAAGFIEPAGLPEGNCCCGIYNRKKQVAVFIRFNKNQLPCLTNWQHWGKNEYVTGLEPGTNFPLGQNYARENQTLRFLKPGETYLVEIEMEVLTDPEKIKTIISKEINF